jgi:hypothetical protein
VSAYTPCPECDVRGLGPDALLAHRWRRHTGIVYRQTFGRALRASDPVKWDDLRPSEIRAAIVLRHRTLDGVLAW